MFPIVVEVLVFIVLLPTATVHWPSLPLLVAYTKCRIYFEMLGKLSSEELALRVQNAASLEDLVKMEESLSQQANCGSALSSSGAYNDCADSKAMRDKLWESFSVAVAAFHADLFLLLTLFEIGADDPQSCQLTEAPLNCLLSEESWRQKQDELFDRYASLERSIPPGILELEPLRSERDLLNKVKVAGDRALAAFQDDHSSDSSVEKALAELKVLNEWTEKQVLNLESIQDDSKSLQGFAYEVVQPVHRVLEKAQTLIASIELSSKDARLLEALKQFNEMWLYFLSSLRNRLDCVLCELHDSKPLELLVSECVAYLKRLPSFMEEIDDLQLLPAGHDGVIAATRVEEFQKTLEAWKERYAQLRLALMLFYQASLSGLTWLPTEESLIVQSAQRQQEFETVSRELQEWAEEESHSDTWREVYGSIVAIKNRVSLLMD